MTADHYAAAGRGWATGAELVYGPIAAELITLSPHPLAGHTVLDAEAGTGARRTPPCPPNPLDLGHQRQPAGVTTQPVQAGRSHVMTFRASWC